MQKESNGKSVAFFVICMPQSPKYRRRKCIPSLRCSNSVDNGGTKQKKYAHLSKACVYSCCGGDEGGRTPYLLNAIQALYQLSYTPEMRCLLYSKQEAVSSIFRKLRGLYLHFDFNNLFPKMS